MRIGVLGGAFNPVHCAHLLLACRALKLFRLNQVLFIPNAAPPHKDTCQVSYSDRRRILAAALGTFPDLPFGICDLEADPQVPHYTVDTLTLLRRQLPDNCGLFFLMGMDEFLLLDTWSRWQSLTDLCHLVVAGRAGSPLASGHSPELERFIKSCTVTAQNPLNQEQRRLAATPSGSCFICDFALPEVSSTALRADLAAGATPALVPPAALECIRHLRLYTTAIKTGD